MPNKIMSCASTSVTFVLVNLLLSTNGFTYYTPALNLGRHLNRSSQGIIARDAVRSSDDETSCKRRVLLESSLATVISLVTMPNNARADLLEEFGTDTSKKPVKLVGAQQVKVVAKEESAISPNLRANYYYPTNKKRYLPRIKKCNDAIPGAAASIGTEDWEAVTDFAIKIADDTILPLKLYTSSLSGGGTNVKVSFIGKMKDDSLKFEKYQVALVKAIKKKDQSASSTALEGMAVALSDYRNIAGLTGPDGGGDIPSVDEIRRSACRVQGRSFELKVKERDARLSGASEVVVTVPDAKKR
mmetsp:Transcript_51159/g.59778  ORF Transcript_51159/g.59778 Transcript_51159/m.59778 type:complete len:301 (+) Transcript_51159:93-995(+)